MSSLFLCVLVHVSMVVYRTFQMLHLEDTLHFGNFFVRDSYVGDADLFKEIYLFVYLFIYCNLFQFHT